MITGTAYDPWKDALVWVMLDNINGVWIEAKVLSHSSAPNEEEWTFIVEFNDRSKKSIKTFSIDFANNLEFQWLKRRDSENKYSSVDDMTHLSYLNEPEMLECLRLRYNEDKIYTNTGPILIAVNPFKRLPIYGPDVLKKYYKEGIQNHINDPHVFSTSDRAYRKMFVDRFDPSKRENQAILVNGESGAGKTETTKYVLHYLAEVSSYVASNFKAELTSGDVENQVIASNPITESFGNAKTSRNNNSSRFGKYIELLYTSDGYIEGARIRTYLLEAIRVVRQQPGDRNFHIFYEIFAGLKPEVRKTMLLESLESFEYTNQSGEYCRYDNESDADNYHALLNAFTTIQIPQDYQHEIIRIVIGILHIGNITFRDSEETGSDKAIFSDESKDSIDMVCQLLGFNVESLLTAVTSRVLTVAGTDITKTLNSQTAIYARDSLSKTIYEMLFKWIITQVNTALSCNIIKESACSIGVLDIFGFEHFECNSFEQLCINYTNEKLQDHFNYSIFKSEQEVYALEGLNWTFVDYPDNSARLDLLENRVYGIFPLCDEQLKLPKASDERLAHSYYNKCSQHKYFSSTKADKVNFEFTILHYAAPVKYSTVGFLDKNRGEVAKELLDCLLSSSNELVQFFSEIDTSSELSSIRKNINNTTSMMTTTTTTSPTSSPLPQLNKTKISPSRQNSMIVGTKRVPSVKKYSTVSSVFSKQLQDLVTTIRTTRSHFIRCIKPNADLKPAIFQKRMGVDQLRCGGALGAIQVFRAGFSNRMDYESFSNRYTSLSFPCGSNPISKEYYYVKSYANQTDLTAYWRLAASKLIQIAPLTETVLTVIETEKYPLDIIISEGLMLGRTQVFLRAPVFDHLELLQKRSLRCIAIKILTLFRTMKIVRRQKTITSKKSRAAATSAITFFADYRRRRFLRVVNATIILQRRLRVFIEVRRRLRVILGCTRLQARYRGWIARQRVRKIKYNAATTLQSKFRQYFHYKKLKILKRSTILLQAIIRGWSVRSALQRRLHLAERGMWSVTMMQTLWRGKYARKLYRLLLATIEADRLQKEKEERERKDQLLQLLQTRLEKNPQLLDAMEGASQLIEQLRAQVANLKTDLQESKSDNNVLKDQITTLTVALETSKPTTTTLYLHVNQEVPVSQASLHPEIELPPTSSTLSQVMSQDISTRDAEIAELKQTIRKLELDNRELRVQLRLQNRSLNRSMSNMSQVYTDTTLADLRASSHQFQSSTIGGVGGDFTRSGSSNTTTSNGHLSRHRDLNVLLEEEDEGKSSPGMQDGVGVGQLGGGGGGLDIEEINRIQSKLRDELDRERKYEDKYGLSNLHSSVGGVSGTTGAAAAAARPPGHRGHMRTTSQMASLAADEKVQNLREFIQQLRVECKELRAKIPSTKSDTEAATDGKTTATGGVDTNPVIQAAKQVLSQLSPTTTNNNNTPTNKKTKVPSPEANNNLFSPFPKKTVVHKRRNSLLKLFSTPLKGGGIESNGTSNKNSPPLK